MNQGWAARVRLVYEGVLAAITWIVNTALVIVVLVVLLAVFARYTGYLPGTLHWATEFSRFSIIWIVMLGSVVALHRGAHVAIDITEWLPVRSRWLVRSAAYLLSIVFLAVLAWEGFILSMATMRQISPALSLPMGYAYFAIPVGATFMVLQAALFLVLPSLRGGDSPLELLPEQTM